MSKLGSMDSNKSFSSIESDSEEEKQSPDIAEKVSEVRQIEVKSEKVYAQENEIEEILNCYQRFYQIILKKFKKDT